MMMMRGSDRKLCSVETKRGKVWMEYVKKFMNEEDRSDHNVDTVHETVMSW